MIKNDAEYKEARRRIDLDRQVAEEQRRALKEAGLSEEQVKRGMEPLLLFQQQLAGEMALYDNVLQRRLPRVRRLPQIGPLLVALRVANGITQRELAHRLGVSESAVCRDERSEYRGITLERAQRVLDALEESLSITVDNTTPATERYPATAAAG